MPILALPHVDQAELIGLQERLEAFSKISKEFLVLLAGSTVIATLGLFQNSPAVIIGAMIIAPLMRPLLGLSLATLTADLRLLSNVLITLACGTAAGIAISFSLALFLHYLELTPEILGRTHPTLLDLGVAIFAGAIGAYCQTKVKLADSMAGVAIAVALVPPLSVVGIGLAFGNFNVWTGAGLLYLTNLVGIAFAGSLVFLIKGYTPLNRAGKGLAISSLMALLLIVPLAFSMRELILENQISTTVKSLLRDKTQTFHGIQVREVTVQRFKSPMNVNATVLLDDHKITSKQVKLVQDFLVKEVGLPINFKLRIIPSTELSGMDAIAPIEIDIHKHPLNFDRINILSQ